MLNNVVVGVVVVIRKILTNDWEKTSFYPSTTRMGWKNKRLSVAYFYNLFANSKDKGKDFKH